MTSDALDSLLDEGVATSLFPCAAYAVVTPHGTASGAVGDVNGVPVTDRTPFDLASLTKVVATTCIAFRGVREGRISLSSSVHEVLPEFKDERVTVRNLLQHDSGLPAYLDLALDRPTPEEVWSRIVSLPLSAAPGSKTEYSCLGFIVLGRLLEASFGEPLDSLFDSTVARPLRLTETAYRSTEQVDPAVPPTAKAEVWRPLPGPLVQGVVHDPLAWLLGGVSGNAGLFGSASDLARFAEALLAGVGPFSEPGWTDWTERQSPSQPRGLGWDFKSDGLTSAGATMSPRSYGHTGFTGTMIWIDPDRKSAVALVSNAVWHAPDREALRRFRSRFCDVAASV